MTLKRRTAAQIAARKNNTFFYNQLQAAHRLSAGQ